MNTKLINVVLFVIMMFAATYSDARQQQQQKRYLTVEDAAVAMARAWQNGEKAKPIMSDDGKIIFAFGQSMPKLTCSPTRACDVELQGGENIFDVIIADKQNWTWAPTKSVEKGKNVPHVVFQPRDNDVESNAIITTDKRTYHIKLYAPKKEGIYLNRVGFYYPDEIVESWESKLTQKAETATKQEELKVVEEAFSPEKADFDYKISGDADFRPLRVFNTGIKVYIELPSSVFSSGEIPILLLIDDDGKANVVNWHRKPDSNFYIVDKLFSKAELRVGKQKVSIISGKRAGWSWFGGGAQ